MNNVDKAVNTSQVSRYHLNEVHGHIDEDIVFPSTAALAT